MGRPQCGLPTCPPGSTTTSYCDRWIPHETTRGLHNHTARQKMVQECDRQPESQCIGHHRSHERRVSVTSLAWVEIGDSSFTPADAHPQTQSVNFLLEAQEALTSRSLPRFINSIPEMARAAPLKSDTVRASPSHKLENRIPNRATSDMEAAADPAPKTYTPYKYQA